MALTPKQIDEWADMMLNEATEDMFQKGIEITPESFSSYFEREYNLSWTSEEAKQWLKEHDFSGV